MSTNSGNEHGTPNGSSARDQAVNDTSAGYSPSAEAILAYNDPTYTIGRLEAASKPILSVRPDTSVKEAVTIMLSNDFSQLPVMTTPREVKGVVTWQSIGVAKLALGRKTDVAREVMEPHHELLSTASLFQAIPVIVQKNYVLIRGPDNQISGIVTAGDLSLQFRQLSEPFLLLGEIENHIRGIIGNTFSVQELAAAGDPGDTTRTIKDAADLSLGEYLRLLEHPERWDKLALALDRPTFCKQLESVRKIRNGVMHFRPDGTPREELQGLRDFVGLLKSLRR